MAATMASMVDATPNTRRRWLQFSLRFLLLLIAVVAIPLAWKVNRVRNQRAVLAEIQRLGGARCTTTSATITSAFRPAPVRRARPG